MTLDESKETDNIIKSNEIDVIIDGEIKNFFGDDMVINIDYINSPYGSGFTIDTGNSCNSSCC